MKDLVNFMYLLKESYLKAVTGVCQKYNLTSAEFDVLMFLANSPEYDTAKDIVEKRCIAKSHVSMSVKALEAKKYLERKYKNNNRRTVHLEICDLAKDVIRDGKAAQDNFYEIILKGFSKQDIENMKQNIDSMLKNMGQFVEGIV